jgi:hypothetical protein
MTVEQFVDWEVEDGSEVLREIPPQCLFVRRRSHAALLGIEAEPPLWEVGY